MKKSLLKQIIKEEMKSLKPLKEDMVKVDSMEIYKYYYEFKRLVANMRQKDLHNPKYMNNIKIIYEKLYKAIK